MCFSQPRIFGCEVTSNVHWLCCSCVYLQIDSCGPFRNLGGEGGDVDASITLPKNIKFIVHKVWEFEKETLEGLVVVFGHLKEKNPQLLNDLVWNKGFPDRKLFLISGTIISGKTALNPYQ